MNRVSRIIFAAALFTLSLYAQGSEAKKDSEIPGILPVELVYFYGLETGDSISLFWGTATEINNYGFQVQRGFEDSTNFETIGFVFGHGTSYSPKSYTFGDTGISEAGRYYYRLKQIDNDGVFKYSWISSVGFLTTVKLESVDVPAEFHLYQNFPNPFNPVTRIRFDLTHNMQYPVNTTLKIFDMRGRVVSVLFDGELYPGEYSIEFDASNFASGIYIYQLENKYFNSTRKMILLK